MSTQEKTAPRTSYHHGDLRNALSAAALDLAREGGPEAVVLREAARRVGVSATAAYRHFTGQGDLLTEVKNQALAELARSMERALGTCEPGADPGALAVARLRSAAHGYLAFAFAEPGLFNAAFCRDRNMAPLDPPTVDFAADNAFGMLCKLLDDLVVAGLMPAQRRPAAEFACWASVHGLAILFLEGPLRRITGEDRAAAIDRAIENNIRGLICGGEDHP